ncbi:MAG: hypothetical protein ACOY3Y_16725 [Acidobacteriota bacterium]
MSDAIDTVREARNLLERIAAKLPGFRGYLERELRRETDQSLREGLAGRLDACRDRVSGYTRGLSLGSGGELQRARALDLALDAAAVALRHAGSGYAGYFDAFKVGEEQLAELYHHDLGLVESVEAIEAVSAALGERGEALSHLESAVSGIRAQIDSRPGVVRSAFGEAR